MGILGYNIRIHEARRFGGAGREQADIFFLESRRVVQGGRETADPLIPMLRAMNPRAGGPYPSERLAFLAGNLGGNAEHFVP